MDYREIIKELDRARQTLAAERKVAETAFQARVKEIRAQCATIGHIFKEGGNSLWDHGRCCAVCGEPESARAVNA